MDNRLPLESLVAARQALDSVVEIHAPLHRPDSNKAVADAVNVFEQAVREDERDIVKALAAEAAKLEADSAPLTKKQIKEAAKND